MVETPIELKRKRLNIPKTGQMDEYLALVRVCKDNKFLIKSPTDGSYVEYDKRYFFIFDDHLKMVRLNGTRQELTLKKSIEFLLKVLGMYEEE